MQQVTSAEDPPDNTELVIANQRTDRKVQLSWADDSLGVFYNGKGGLHGSWVRFTHPIDYFI